MMKYARFFLSVTILAVLCAPLTMAQENATEKPGKVHFPVSCNAEAQARFDGAVAILHSFWYEEAAKTFTAVTEADPSCAMGHWGIAMSIYYPLWVSPDQSTLQKGLSAVEKAKSIGAKTDRERAYIGAIEVFYKDSDKLDHRTRALAYEKAMEAIYLRYPEDQEAAVFYALALNATAPPTDKTYAKQLKAGEILEEVFAEQPNHPGVAHYIIHSYDNPVLASRGLTAARRYAKIDPAVPHAQHMPSHIFTRLGLWQESIQSNLGAVTASKDYEAKTHPGAAYYERLLDELTAILKVQPEAFQAAYAFAAVPARYTIEKRRWSDAASLTLYPSDFPWSRFPWAEAVIYFARALGSARSGNVTDARKDIEKLGALHEALVKAKDKYWAEQVDIQGRAVGAWLAHAEGQNEEALKLMRAAADREDSTEKHPVTPAPIVPTRELLGDLLLELNEPKKALSEFERSLGREPNRFHALYGAARAAELSGDRQKARTYYEKAVALCSQADTERPELQQAKAFLAKK